MLKKAIIFLSLLLMMSCGNSKSDSDAGQDAAPSEQSTEDTETEDPYTPPPDYGTGSGEGDAGDEVGECFFQEPCAEPRPYVRQLCQFPLTPELDGELDDSVWETADWSTVAHDIGMLAADDDADASFDFACVADEEFMYFAFRVRDDTIVNTESSGCDVWQDDSIEFYIDQCHNRAPIYDGDEAQISIGAENIGVTDQDDIVLGGCSGPFPGPDTGTLVHAVATDDGWAGEIAIPLHPRNGWDLSPVDGQVIGFNSHYNDDDDTGDRDSKLIWSLEDRELDASYQNPAVFGELQFCDIREPDTGTGDEIPDAGPDGGEDTATEPTDTGTGIETGTGGEDTGTGLDTATETVMDTETAIVDTETATQELDAGLDAGQDTNPDAGDDTETAPGDTETATSDDTAVDTETATAEDTETQTSGDTASATEDAPDAGDTAADGGSN